ncbi:MAG TPA: hypothetical protein VIK85_00370 [Coriobacteriia bacterium]
MTVRGPHFDADAALWFAVALLVTAFATIPVLSVGLAIAGQPLDGAFYIGVTGGLAALVFGVTTAVLVRNRPWRTFGDTLWTLYVLQLVAATLLAVGQFVRAPMSGVLIARGLLAPLTFGVVQIDSFSPLQVAFPDAWPLVGTLVGLVAGRWLLTRRGRAVGEAARVVVEPMRLPRP